MQKKLVIAIRQQAKKQSHDFLQQREINRLLCKIPLRCIFLAITGASISHDKSENSINEMMPLRQMKPLQNEISPKHLIKIYSIKSADNFGKLRTMKTALIRNFCVIAHIDHGKSTLADRLLELTSTVSQRDMKAQLLDDMDLERERGITIKSHPITMQYSAKNGNQYTLNMIDTPGHVDFTYEVSRSMAACEGALLLVDASQGVEAQTVSNLFLAMDNNLEIIPVLNKVDLPNAQVETCTRQIIDLLGGSSNDILHCSAKTGEGMDTVLETIINQIPAPENNADKPFRALIFDSVYDDYRGVVPYVRVFDGEIAKNDVVQFLSNGLKYEASEIGIFTLKRINKPKLSAGDVGYIICGIKKVHHVAVGDTITNAKNPAQKQLKGYKEIKPMVFSGLYPVLSDDFENLRTALEKLKLNDASLWFEPDTSVALGFGFRCGYLGLLHMEIIQERLEREFNLNLISTTPNVKYRIQLAENEILSVQNPAEFPEPGKIVNILEPYVKLEMITPAEYVGGLMKLCQDRRGQFQNQHYFSENKVQLLYEMPLSEIILDFYNRLKSISRGYASMDYEFIDYKIGKLQKLDSLINGDFVDAFSSIVHIDFAYHRGLALCQKLKELIPRQLFEVAIQASLQNKIIARTTVKALRKNVTAKCYGGDITRKRKLLEKQKEGKKRMKQVGSVGIPQEAFFAVLQIET